MKKKPGQRTTNRKKNNATQYSETSVCVCKRWLYLMNCVMPVESRVVKEKIQRQCVCIYTFILWKDGIIMSVSLHLQRRSTDNAQHATDSGPQNSSPRRLPNAWHAQGREQKENHLNLNSRTAKWAWSSDRPSRRNWKRHWRYYLQIPPVPLDKTWSSDDITKGVEYQNVEENQILVCVWLSKRMPLHSSDFRFVWPQNSLEVANAQWHSLCSPEV